MIRLKFEPALPPHRIIEKACEVMGGGGVIAYPTDTIYGFGCSIFSEKAVRRVYKIKGRNLKKQMSIICSDLDDIANYATIPNFAYRIMKRYLPGPYTFILQASKEVPKYLRSGRRTVGIRVPDHSLCSSLVRELGAPIISTSVNRTGTAPLNDPDLVEDVFGKDIDLFIDSGFLLTNPSTVIDCSGGQPEVLRQGEGEVDF